MFSDKSTANRSSGVWASGNRTDLWLCVYPGNTHAATKFRVSFFDLEQTTAQKQAQLQQPAHTLRCA